MRLKGCTLPPERTLCPSNRDVSLECSPPPRSACCVLYDESEALGGIVWSPNRGLHVPERSSPSTPSSIPRATSGYRSGTNVPAPLVSCPCHRSQRCGNGYFIRGPFRKLRFSQTLTCPKVSHCEFFQRTTPADSQPYSSLVPWTPSWTRFRRTLFDPSKPTKLYDAHYLRGSPSIAWVAITPPEGKERDEGLRGAFVAGDKERGSMARANTAHNIDRHGKTLRSPGSRGTLTRGSAAER